ncbi:hypothetical protein [Nocardiopsis sp. NPDC006938]|uniref:hypothetical protein n=1 Tax=Nocardiopsis sp. NPDC006938 TaxID=3364337 RepID=UPI0036CD7CB7
MSPKKRNRRKPLKGSAQAPANDRDHSERGRVEPGSTPDRRPLSRTPLTLAEPPDRRVTALWVVLWALWGLGSPLALLALLLAGLNAFDTATLPLDPAAAPDPGALADQEAQAVRAIGTALVWFLIMAWAVPALGAVTATVLRRKMAAIAFTVALALSVGLLLLTVSPGELWAALSAHLSG